MSLHWVALHKSAFNSKVSDIAKIIAKLQQQGYDRVAEIFAKIDWRKLGRENAIRAVKHVAKAKGVKFLAEYPNRIDNMSYKGDVVPAGHECIGVISNGTVHLGVAVDKRGALTFFENGYSRERGSGNLPEWRKAIEKKYAQLTVAAALKEYGAAVKTVDGKKEVAVVAVLPTKKKDGDE